MNLLIQLITGLALPGLSASDTPFPLEPNSRWTYVHDGRQSTIVEVMERRRLGEAETTIVRSRGSWPLGSGQLLVTSSAEQLALHGVVLGQLTFTNEPPLLYLKFPLIAGQQWRTDTVHPETLMDRGLAITVLARETVDVPAGRFDTWKIEYVNSHHLGTEEDFTVWFAPGTGFVKYSYWGRSKFNGGDQKKEMLEAPRIYELASLERDVVIEDPPITKGHGAAFTLDQLPRRIAAPEGQVSLFADFGDVRGEHVVLYLINRTDQPIMLGSQDGDLYVKLEAEFDGRWERAQGHSYSSCGNSYLVPTLEPDHFFRFLGEYPDEGESVAVRYRKYVDVQDLRELGTSTVSSRLISNSGVGRVSREDVEKCRYDAMAAHFSDDLAAVTQMARGERFTGSVWEAAHYRGNAIQSLKRFPGPQARELATELLSDQDVGVRSAAISVLATVAPTLETVAVMEAQSASGDHQVRNAAIHAVAMLEAAQPRAREVWIALLDAEDSQTRRTATRCLSRFSDSQEMVKLVRKSLQDEDSLVRISAVQALGDVAAKCAEAVPLIEEMLAHDDPHVRSSAALAWSRAPLSDRTVPALRSLLASEQDTQVIRSVINILGNLARQSPDARDLLIDLSLSPASDLRGLAVSTLERIERSNTPR